jgi:tripartite ATP-independent transporter DctM subunit
MSFEILAGIFVLFSMAALGAPVAYAILSGIIVYLGVAGQDLAIAGQTMVQRLFDGFLLLAVPLFIVTANIMNAGSISDRLLNFCVAVVGRFRGGLGHVNVMASLIFSGMSGSAVADAAGIGKLVIEMMVKSGRYSRGYAAAITAATATIGPIIPPSIPMVLYALVFKHFDWVFVLSRYIAGFNNGFSSYWHEYMDFLSAGFWERRTSSNSTTAIDYFEIISGTFNASNTLNVYI